MKIVDHITILKWDYLNDNLTKKEYIDRMNSLVTELRKKKIKNV